MILNSEEPRLKELMQPDDVMLNKAGVLQRCLGRIREEYQANPELDNFTHQDALILNIERACQACIDLAMHICAVKKLGIPQSSADVFRLLKDKEWISADTAGRMARMTGFRNRAVHMYQELDLAIVRKIAEEDYQDFISFANAIGLSIEE